MLSKRIGLEILALRFFHQMKLQVEGRPTLDSSVYNTYTQDLT
jgi:hypothetical protein